MAATSKGLAPNERDMLFKTLQGLIQNGDVPIEDLNTLVAELNQQTKPDASQQDIASFHGSHLSDIFAAADFGDFAAEDGSNDQDDFFAGQLEATEWPDESENPFPDDFITAEGHSDKLDATFGFPDHSEKSHSSRQSKLGQSRGRSSGTSIGTGDNRVALSSRGRSRNTRGKKTAEDVLSSAWEPFNVDHSTFNPPSSSNPPGRRKSQSKVEGAAAKKQPVKKREEARESTKDGWVGDTRVLANDAAESPRRRASSSHRKSHGPDPDTPMRTPTKTREKTRSLSRKKRDGEKSNREANDTKNLDAVLAHMLNLSTDKDNLTTSGDTATTSSETKVSEETHKKSPRKKVVKKVAAGIRADDVSTILKAIESGMIETNSAGKIVIRMAKQKKKSEGGPKGASLSKVLDAQKLANGSAENRSTSSAPVQTTERLPGAGPLSPAQRRRSRSRKSRLEGTEEEIRGKERSKSQGRRHEPLL